MAWTTPMTFVAGTVLPASDLNTYLRDNTNALRGGGIAISSQAALDFLYATSTTQFGRVAAVAGKFPRLNLAGTAWEMVYPGTGVSALTDGATPALDASLGNVFTLAAAGDRTITTPTNPTSGQKIVICHFASGGARTLQLNIGAGGFRYGTDITALTQTASGKTDYIGVIYNATDSRWDIVAYTKGF